VLLQNGAEVNIRGVESETCLHAAAALGYVPVITMLLQYHADINAVAHVGMFCWNGRSIRIILS